MLHEFLACKDNVVASIGKIIKFQNSKIPNLEKVINYWLYKLPIVNDVDEGPEQHELLMKLIDSNPKSSKMILGENQKNLPHLLKIFISVLDTKLIHK